MVKIVDRICEKTNKKLWFVVYDNGNEKQFDSLPEANYAYSKAITHSKKAKFPKANPFNYTNPKLRPHNK